MSEEEDEDAGEREAAERERTPQKDIGREAGGQMHKTLSPHRQKYAEGL